MKLRISSRKSPLAQIQSYQVGESLKNLHPQLEVEYFFRQSLGDQNQNDPLWKMPEKGVFTEDFYADLIQGKTDLVVHSWKDLPTENKPDTYVAATLPRADQRDVLLYKKSSWSQTKVKCFSSSPRRSFNLKSFLMKALPWKTDSIEFLSVRGNISTRVQKLIEDPAVDGLIVAKAALDRLLADQRFPETQSNLRSAFDQLEWMILPLSENPNAAAQGALAIEIAKTHQKAKELILSINCQDSFECASREREILKEFGGGCHLAIGVSVLNRPYGRIEVVKGLTPAGEIIKSRKLIPSRPKVQDLSISKLEFEKLRSSYDYEVPAEAQAVFVSRIEAASEKLQGKIVWAAGVQTWEKLAQLGVWVHGCAEGLGEKEDAQIDILLGYHANWAYLTHDSSFESVHIKQIPTYKLDLRLKNQSLPSSDAFRWKSSSEFLLAFQKFPELRNRYHICGPGRSFEVIKNCLGTEEKIFVELHDEIVSTI